MSAEILFNSHALNSLQRSQLIKLCKRYGIKSTGKNYELVAKLEAFAQTLPPASTFTCPSEADLQPFSDDDSGLDSQHLSQQSDQLDWEQVSPSKGADMEQPNADSLGVPPRARSGTVGSWRSGKSSKSSDDFGKGGTSSKSSSIASSFKSFASGLIPGRSHKPVSAPAPESARVPSPPLPPQLRDLTPPRESTPTPPQTPERGPTTVRLIPSPGPNALPRSKSAADLLEGLPLPTPTLNKIATELAGAEKILNGEESPPAAQVSFGFGAAGYEDGELEVGDVSMASISKLDNEIRGDAILAGLPPAAPPTEELDPPDQPFVFGHPRHSVTNTQFGDAAAAVLREMNARMGVNNPGQGVSIEQLEGVMANAGKDTAPLRVEKKADVRFGNTHAKEFAKMDSIANHYSIQAKKRKSEHTTAPAPTTDEPTDKIFTLPPHLSTTTESPRNAKRARISTADGSEPTGSNKVLTDSPAVRAQLEKRRSSAAGRRSGVGARKSGPGARKSGAGAAAPKGGFGFMRMVRGIWGSKPKEPEKPKPVEVKKPSPPPAAEPTKKFPSAPTHEPVTLPSVPKTRVVSASVAEEKKSVGLGRPSGSGVGRAVSQAVVKKADSAAPTGTIGKTRTGSSLYAPTAASLARQGTAAKPTMATSTNGATRTSTLRSRAATTGTDGPKSSTARPLPVPPTTVGRATTSNAATQGSARMVSPPARAASTTGVARKSVASTSATATGRKSTVAQPARKSVAAGTRSPSGTGLARSPTGGRKSIFSSPLTVDAMTMRGSAPTVQPFRLSPQGNLNPVAPTADEAVDAPKSGSDGAKPSGAIGPSPKSRPAASPSKPRLASIPSKPSGSASKPPVTRPAARRPRISRSKVIARLGEKRAAASVASPSNKALSPVSKARSSLQVRRSMGGAVAAKRALDADKIRARRSEAANRRSRIAEGHGFAGRRSEGAVLRRRGMD